jgi:hypothetical protein
MRAFIVRPFGTKDVLLGGSAVSINFDLVEEALIFPALKAAGLEGGTTVEIVEQGNIREDMFRLLVTSDIVVADVSIHNANVFYELGIRHGLRESKTFLLRANIDTYPFDLATDRYLVYDPKRPAVAIKELTRALKATLVSNRIDSPVYQVLPSLRPPDPSVLQVVPRDFVEAAERAGSTRARGDLRLLAYEAHKFNFPWALEGLRTVGRAQFRMQAYRGAQETFEWLLEKRQGDVEANQKLAKVYQWLSEQKQEAPHKRADYLARSTQAIQRVIDAQGTTRRDRAEAYTLKGHNARARWVQSFAHEGAVDHRVMALRSPGLTETLRGYASGFQQDLNHFYSGTNAMALLRIRIDVAQALPEVWNDMFDDTEDAQTELAACESQFQQLSGAVALSLQASRNALQKEPNPDPDEQLSTAICEADHAFLTGRRARTVAQRYREALTDASIFAVNTVREHLTVFDRLQVRSDFVKEVRAALDEVSQRMAQDTLVTGPHIKRIILFTGHRIDAKDRPSPRFPRTDKAEREARRLIEDAVKREIDAVKTESLAMKKEGRHEESELIRGIAGGACGGHILFHEVCAELGIETKMFLPLPKEAFCARSVQYAGADWVGRYERLVDRLKPRVLSETEELPPWLQGHEYDIWQRQNIWILFNALALNAQNLTLIALWNHGRGDGRGGTAGLVSEVSSRGYKVVRLEAERLKDL